MGTTPARKKTPSARETARRARESAKAKSEPEAQGEQQPTYRVCLAPVDEKGELPDHCKPVQGVMCLIDGDQVGVLPVGIHDLMVGDTLNNAQKAHRQRFE